MKNFSGEAKLTLLLIVMSMHMMHVPVLLKVYWDGGALQAIT